MDDMTVYRIITIIVGLIVIYFGYLLFVKGVFSESGDIEAVWGDNQVLIKRGAPGTFFVVFGSLIIIFSMLKGLEESIVLVDTSPPPKGKLEHKYLLDSSSADERLAKECLKQLDASSDSKHVELKVVRKAYDASALKQPEPR